MSARGPFGLALALAAALAGPAAATPPPVVEVGADVQPAEAGPSRAARLAPRTLRVGGAPGVPALQLLVRPDTASAPVWGRMHEVGLVRVETDPGGRVLQRIVVHSEADASALAAHVRLVDVDFDGHPDLGTLAAFGASWCRYEWRRWNPVRLRFESTALTRELSTLRAGTFTFDAHDRSVSTRHLQIGRVVRSQRFEVHDGRLVRAAAPAGGRRE